MGWASYQEDNISRFIGAAPLEKSKSKTRHLPPVASPKAAKASAARSDLPKGKEKTNLKEFSVSSARPLPVVIMADVSGSMGEDGKIDALNSSIREMVAAFAQEDSDRSEIHVAVVTFGGRAALQVPLTPARDVSWTSAEARGRTPMGAAIDIVTDLVEDRDRLPGRSYRPTIVLASDGVPTDEWHGPLTRLLESDRSKRAQRIALAIGADADHDVLRQFLDDPEGHIFQAHEVREIRKFFRWVTMSVTSRSRSVRPNQVVDILPLELDDYGAF